jgi:hypothetical protein
LKEARDVLSAFERIKMVKTISARITVKQLGFHHAIADHVF